MAIKHSNVLIARPEALQDGQVGERGFFLRTAGRGMGEAAFDGLDARYYFTRMEVLHRCKLQKIGFRIIALGGAAQVNVRVACYTSAKAGPNERPYRRLTQAGYMYTTVGAKWADVPEVELEPGLFFLAFQCDSALPTFVGSAYIVEDGLYSSAATTFGSFPLHIDPDNGVTEVRTATVCMLGWLKLRAYRGR